MSASAPPTRPKAPRSAIRAKPPLDPEPGRAVSAARRSADASRWRGTHAGTATEWPRPLDPRQALPRAGKRFRETANPRDLRKRERWYRVRSPTAALVGQIADGFPQSLAKLSLSPPSVEARSAQFERRAALCV